MQAFRFLKFLKLDVLPSVIDDLATKQPNILNFNFLRATGVVFAPLQTRFGNFSFLIKHRLQMFPLKEHLSFGVASEPISWNRKLADRFESLHCRTPGHRIGFGGLERSVSASLEKALCASHQSIETISQICAVLQGKEFVCILDGATIILH